MTKLISIYSPPCYLFIIYTFHTYLVLMFQEGAHVLEQRRKWIEVYYHLLTSGTFQILFDIPRWVSCLARYGFCFYRFESVSLTLKLLLNNH